MLGHSHGAYVTLKYASLFPEGVNNLVLANGFHNYQAFGNQLLNSLNGTYRSIIEKYFKADSKEKNEFMRIYDELIEKANKNQLKLFRKFKNGIGESEYFVPNSQFEFPLVRLMESFGIKKVFDMLQGWIKLETSALKWLKTEFYFEAEKEVIEEARDIFACSEAIPQIRMHSLMESVNAEVFSEFENLAGCRHITGRRRSDFIELSRIKKPILIIASENDQMVPVEYQLETAKQLPQSEFKLIYGAGHFPFKPEFKASEIVLEFFIRNLTSD